ncbi:recombinase family protein [Priestia aryabhattai]|uniref:recombinase family protein n=1 Tax=Priestia aryabhattai TaxID=412384 RepID=UPI002E21C75A|nr:recombinase family protein [Priestia aryabhattai]
MQKSKGLKKVIGYVRVSSESQLENTSISEQKRKIEAYCSSQDWQLVELFIDEGFSGSNIKRPGYQNMMKYLSDNSNEIEAVVVLKMDRAHRNQLNLLKFIKEELSALEVDFVSVTESFDTSTHIGRMMLGILSTFGEFERETINERTKGGRLARANENKRAGGSIPYGYKLEDGQVKADEAQSKVVKRIFTEYLEGDSANKIAKRLNNEGIKPKRGKAWTAKQVLLTVKNETYTGFNTYNGKKEKNNIRQKGIFKAIISRQLWNKVQTKLSEQ